MKELNLVAQQMLVSNMGVIMVFFIALIILFIAVFIYVIKVSNEVVKAKNIAYNTKQIVKSIRKDSEYLQEIILDLHSKFYTVKKTDLNTLIKESVSLQERDKKLVQQNNLFKKEIFTKKNKLYEKDLKTIPSVHPQKKPEPIKDLRNFKDSAAHTKRIKEMGDINSDYIVGWQANLK